MQGQMFYLNWRTQMRADNLEMLSLHDDGRSQKELNGGEGQNDPLYQVKHAHLHVVLSIELLRPESPFVVALRDCIAIACVWNACTR